MKISCRLRPVKDDDLRDWYNSLPDGDKSRIVRNVLKEYAGAGQAEILDYKPARKNNYINVGTQLDDINFKEKKVDNELNEDVINDKVDNLLNNF